MPILNGKYTFLPWLRKGFSNLIPQELTHAPDSNTGTPGRASIPVAIDILSIEGDVEQTDTIIKEVELKGPGDILKLDPSLIVRVEPQADIKNFEANYLPFVEFYEADLPWRYTPASPDDTTNYTKSKLTPWIYLLALKPNEFTWNNLDTSTPSIVLNAGAEAGFAHPGQLWAFAHVQSNEQFDIPVDDTASSADVIASYTADPNTAFSRILCPRRLEPGQDYELFFVSS